MDLKEKQEKIVETLHLKKAKRHIFLCCDHTKPKCCDEEAGLASGNYLKTRLKELRLSEQAGILGSKVIS